MSSPVSKSPISGRHVRGLVGTVLALAALSVSTVALGWPWDVDMADNAAKKAYSVDMRAPPAGVVAQPSITSPKPYVTNHVRGTPDGESLTNPMPDDEATRALGSKMYGIYCAPCHGADGINLGPVAAPGRLPGVLPLAGPAGAAKARSDAYVYLTIRNGGNVMPSYGWAMSDAEMWAVVTHVRTLPDAKYVPPEAP